MLAHINADIFEFSGILTDSSYDPVRKPFLTCVIKSIQFDTDDITYIDPCAPIKRLLLHPFCQRRYNSVAILLDSNFIILYFPHQFCWIDIDTDYLCSFRKLVEFDPCLSFTKAAAQRAQERAEAQLAGQKASQGKPAETEEARQKAAPSEQESEDAIGIPQEDNSGGEYTEDVSTEGTDTED